MGGKRVIGLYKLLYYTSIYVCAQRIGEDRLVKNGAWSFFLVWD